MAEFSENSLCIKCGNDYADSEYSNKEDVVKRKCRRCGYAWKEEPIKDLRIPSIKEFESNVINIKHLETENMSYLNCIKTIVNQLIDRINVDD